MLGRLRLVSSSGSTPASASSSAPTGVWLCGGVRRLYRVTDGSTDYGEWDSLSDAQTFLELLLAGNPATLRREYQ